MAYIDEDEVVNRFYDPQIKEKQVDLANQEQEKLSVLSRLLNLDSSEKVNSFTSKVSLSLISLICK